jgi:proteasome accessory factor B
VDPHATLGIEPVVRVDPAFEPLTGAVRDRRAVTFDYRTPSADAPACRRLQPWGVVCWRGRWYVVGHDLDRQAPRCFRLSRVVGPVRVVGGAGAFRPPEHLDLIGYVARWSGPGELPRTVTVRVRPGRGAGIRRWAGAVDGDIVRLRYSDPDAMAARLARYGADVVVLDPPEVREAVVRLLDSLAERYPQTVGSPAAVPLSRGSGVH